MAWRSHGFDNASLVNALLRNGVLRNERVANAMRAVDRGHYVPSYARGAAYQDSPLPIGFEQTISAPHMHAHCAEIMEAACHPGARVLDVGSGSGYLTAVFAKLVGPTGRVTGIEVVPELVERSAQSLASDSAVADMVKSGAVSVHVADAHRGWAKDAPYDAIHVGAAAEEVPAALIDELAPNGVLVIPVGPEGGAQSLYKITKNAEGEVAARELMGVRYVPLVKTPEPVEKEL